MGTIDRSKEQLIKENDQLRASIDELQKSEIEIQKIENRLMESELKSRAWLENSPVCTKIVDLDFNLQYMSSSGIIDLKIDDITEFYGKPYPLHFYPDSFKIPMTNNLRKVKKTGMTIIQEAPIIDVDGKELWYHSTIIPVNNKTGKLDYIMVISLEITVRRQAEDELRQSEDTYRTLLNNLNSGVVVHAPDTSVIMANPTACDLLGLSVDQMKGKKAMDPQWKFLNDDNSDMLLEDYPVNRVISSKEPLRNLVVGVNRPLSAEVRWLLVNGYSVINDSEKIEQVIISFIDITERNQAEANLIASDKKYRSLFENMNEGFALHEIIVNNHGDPIDYKFLEINKAFAKQTGLDPEKVIGSRVKELFPGIEKDPANWIRKYGRVALTGEDLHFENYFEVTGHWYQIHAFSPEKNLFAVTFSDITERKQAELEILKHHNHLEELVTERTSELEESLKNVERMNELFVNREFRIKELRDEVKELKKKD